MAIISFAFRVHFAGEKTPLEWGVFRARNEYFGVSTKDESDPEKPGPRFGAGVTGHASRVPAEGESGHRQIFEQVFLT